MERKDVLRTKKLIEDAYIELIFENKQRITVNSIIEKAGVSRSTFYAHYQDIPTLDESIENRIINYINTSIANISLEELIRDPQAKLRPLLNALFSRKEFLHMLIVGGWKPLVLQKIRDSFDEVIDWDKLNGADRRYVEAANTCIKGVMFEACYYLSMSDKPVDSELLINTVCEFISGGMASLVAKISKISGKKYII